MLLKNFVRLEQTGDATIETGEWRCTISFSSIGEFLKQMDFYFPLKSKHLRLAASISRVSKSCATCQRQSFKQWASGNKIVKYRWIKSDKVKIKINKLRKSFKTGCKYRTWFMTALACRSRVNNLKIDHQTQALDV